MKFFNPNPVDAPRLITVYLNGEEYFEDADVMAPGASTLTYGPLENGTWEVVVHWENKIFGHQKFPFACVL